MQRKENVHKDAINKRKSQQRIVLLLSKLDKFLTDNTEWAKTFDCLLPLASVRRLTATQWALITSKRAKNLPSGNEENLYTFNGPDEILRCLIN